MTPRTDDNYILTYSGTKFWPLNPRVRDVVVRDIAHALAHKCRFTGHVKRFYSVAEHSVILANLPELAEQPCEVRLQALLHDAAEAYLPDVARPIKDALVGFREIEEGVLRVVFERFQLPYPVE